MMATTRLATTRHLYATTPRRTLAALAGTSIVLALVGTAWAQSAPRALAGQAPRRLTGVHIDRHSGWSVGLEGYAGLTTLSTSEGTRGHALAGGISRARFGYLELGGVFEVSDEAGERWRHFGGFAGGYLPLTNWVDFDATLGVVGRNYVSTDKRYGPSGLSVQVPALTLRLGLSDRTTEGLIGPRLGAALLFSFDLKHRDVPWSYNLLDASSIGGATRFGGVTAGLVMSFGFDVAVRRDRRI